MGKATHVSRITDGQARKEARDTLKLGRRRTGRRFRVLGDPARPPRNGHCVNDPSTALAITAPQNARHKQHSARGEARAPSHQTWIVKPAHGQPASLPEEAKTLRVVLPHWRANPDLDDAQVTCGPRDVRLAIGDAHDLGGPVSIFPAGPPRSVGACHFV